MPMLIIRFNNSNHFLIISKCQTHVVQQNQFQQIISYEPGAIFTPSSCKPQKSQIDISMMHPVKGSRPDHL